ncbi:MAG: HAMP domain-containing histidine kinase [Proteobacteria bacterium]|nr:MAG: HAMP domain-containing histidine kinase [Pseudomonadota bacterium]
MKTALPIADHLARELRNYKVALPIALSVAIGVGAGLRAINTKQNESVSILRAISPHVAILIETNDGPDLQRLINSISSQLAVKIEVYRADRVFASTLSRERIGVHFQNADRFWLLPSVTGGRIISETKVQRANAPELHVTLRMLSPLTQVLHQVLLVMLTTFTISIAAVTLLVAKLSAVAKRSFKPVQQLDSAIHNLLEDGATEISPFEIQELESIRESVQRVKTKLNAATDELVDARGQKLAALAMKRLMHDLHTPITALSQMMKISMMERMPEEYRAEARIKIVELAEQILRQVGSGKENFETRVNITVGANLSDTLQRTIERVRLAIPANANEAELLLRTESTMSFDHDPELLERVITNLVMNAFEAQATSVQVVAEIEEGSPRIIVIDNGPGMTTNDVALHLSGRGKSSKGSRSGLGLSNCNHIVRLHGGRIIHRASRSGGSEFEVRLKNTAGGGSL